jgi:glutamate-1-semialdehyde 2,1-aminomutase
MLPQTSGPDAHPDAPLYTRPAARRFLDLFVRRKRVLTARQVRQFRDEGLLVIDPKIPADALERVLEEIKSFYPRTAGGEPERVTDAWHVLPGVKDLALAPRVLAALRELYGREPLPFQTDNFPVGTEQPPHADNLGSNSMPAGWKCCVWIALEDVDLDNGPVVYYPGSHLLPEYTLADCGVPAIPDTYAQYERYYLPFIAEVIRKHGLKPSYALVKKGQAVIWASNLLHGGAPRRDRARSRHSQITQYFFPGCKYYTPLFSEPEKVYWRTPTWIKDGPEGIAWKDVGKEDRALLETVELVARSRDLLAQELPSLFFGHLPYLLFADDGELLPQFIESARGCEVVDTAGRTHIDWSLGGGVTLLGYRRPEVEEAVRGQLAAGPLLPMMHRVQVEVAAAIREMVPCAEMVAFGKNGSDAVTAAVRVARAATGRTLVLHSGYHGFHDWYVAGMPSVRGIPAALGPTIASFPYNDLAALEKLLEANRDAVAAVLLDPAAYDLPRPGYLEAVRDLARRHGALLVFDEVVTSFRFGPGGAQGFYGVTPDLAALGKALANGMPLSAVVGRRDLMRHLPQPVGYGMTFQCETLSLAAAKATLAVLRREPVAETVARAGERLREGFGRECARLGIRAALAGHPARLFVSFEPHGPFPAAYLFHLFLAELRARGVISVGFFLGSYAHDERAVERTMAATRAALEVVAGVIASNHFDSWDLPRRPRTEGYIDSVSENVRGVAVSGWLFLDGRPAEAIDFLGVSGRGKRAARVSRPDVGQARPEFERPAEAGFTVFLPREPATLYATGAGGGLRALLIPTGSPALPAPLHRGHLIHI